MNNGEDKNVFHNSSIFDVNLAQKSCHLLRKDIVLCQKPYKKDLKSSLFFASLKPKKSDSLIYFKSIFGIYS
ncbi:MAG: hypothetical protein C0582_03665 [Alphaproteobacteria bacterium]|nr:MAG: hypothetical protein C0582_03665 [Alphaproteobacteria bacterium]